MAEPAKLPAAVDELRAAVRVLRDPVQCLPHAPLFADLLDALADELKTDVDPDCDCWATDPLCRTVLATARALNGATP